MPRKPSYDYAEAIALAATGKETLTSLADRYGVGTSGIKAMLSRHAPHIRLPLGGKGVPRKFDHVKAIEMYAAGGSPKELGAFFGVTEVAVRSLIHRKAPHLVRSASFDHTEALALLASGDHSYDEVAERVGSTANALRCLVRAKAPHLASIVVNHRKALEQSIITLMDVKRCSYAAIAEELNCRSGLVREVLRRRRSDLLRKRESRRKFDGAAVVERYAKGDKSFAEVAKEFGLNPQQACYAVKKLAPEIQRGRGHSYPKISGGLAAELYAQQNLTYAEIGGRFGVTATGAYRAIKKHAPSLLGMAARRRQAFNSAQVNLQISQVLTAPQGPTT